MIRIDELVIEIPAQLKHKASRISRLVQEKSARLRINYRETMDTMAIADIEIKMPANDNAIAEQIISRIEQSLKERG